MNDIIVCVQVLQYRFRCDNDATADACVLVDDCAIDRAIFPNAHGLLRGISWAKFKVVRAHHDAVPDGGATLDDAAYANHASLQVRVRDDTTVRNNRLAQRCAVNFAARQKTRMRIDRRVGLKETIFWNYISQIEISLVKCADRSDVFPVTFEDKRADMPIFDRRWNNVFTEIEQITLQAFDEHLPVENINAH